MVIESGRLKRAAYVCLIVMRETGNVLVFKIFVMMHLTKHLPRSSRKYVVIIIIIIIIMKRKLLVKRIVGCKNVKTIGLVQVHFQ
jgi:hypothetical protein